MIPVKEFRVSDTLTIYKAQYDWTYGQDEIIYRVKQNKWLLGTTDFNTTEIKVHSPEIDHIISYRKQIAKGLSVIPETSNPV